MSSISPQQIELTEARAWVDMYHGAPADFAEQFGLGIYDQDSLVMTRCKKIPFGHFNSVLTLGCPAAFNAKSFDIIAGFYAAAGIAKFSVLHNPHCAPHDLPQIFATHGLKVVGSWDRVALHKAKRIEIEASTDGATVELVTAANATEWSTFIDQCYGLPTGPWLRHLVGRSGWIHAQLRQNGKVASVRSLFVAPDGWAWLGVEAPIPGIMAPSFPLDYRVSAVLVNAAIDSGAHSFVADIEAPSPSRNTEAYRLWAKLGFQWQYTRNIYSQT